ncbi:pentapeptide repeat-containing protein [Hyphomonas beringensis]|uniref:pentapeptide repeat-containing protein n=1 Tax=Hyphomonas beringensis TaxID=1280946 RepID=UPI0012DD2CB6|nr:pentapeptide repeat-containing protein [Hyphomonas beringensis]
MPLTFRDGSQTLKGAEDDAFGRDVNATLSAVLSDEVIETKFDDVARIEGADHRLQWQGAIIGDFDLNKLSTLSRLDCERIPISINAHLAAFFGETQFRQADFLGDADFSYAAFGMYVTFEKASFHTNARFHYAIFSGESHFTDSIFSEWAIFNNSIFLGHALFNRVAFAKFCSFHSAVFWRQAIFGAAAFSEGVSFQSTAFLEIANFSKAVFFGDANFSGEGRSLTSERVDQSIALSSQAGDTGVALEGRLTGEPAALSIARRSVKRFNAKGAMFLGPADFSNRDILNGPSTNESDFHGAHFFHIFKLHGSVLHRGINFGSTNVKLAVERGKTKARFLPVPDALKAGLENLKRAIPEKPQQPAGDAPEWQKEQYVREAAKWSAVYEGDIEAFQKWRQAEALAFKRGPRGDRIEYFRALEDCYRTLKLFNEDRRDRVEEGRFHRLELIARRRRGRPKYTTLQQLAFWQEKEGISLRERIMSRIYGGASNYGNSVARPLVCLIIGMFLFALAYMMMGDWFIYAPNWKHFGEAMAFSLGQVLPFGPWDAPDPCTAIGQMLDPLTGPAQAACKQHLGDGFEHRLYINGTPIGLRLLASLQSLSAIILVFLSGLAIRRRFQIN